MASASALRTDGLCECGCGQRTELAPVTARRLGWVKGQPKRFINGHQAVLKQDHRYRVDEETGCWVLLTPNCTGYKGDEHYGTFHRRVYAENVGPIPDGYVIHHKCEVKACINPDHLEALSNSEHISHHKAPLPPAERAEMLRLYSEGVPPRELAKRFGLRRASIYQITYREKQRTAA